MCGHGLAISRALYARHVKVIAYSADKNEPGAKTNTADVRFISNLEGQEILSTLADLQKELNCTTKIPLFLTNDRMVRFYSDYLPELEKYYALSWSHCSDMIKRLLDKDAIEARCNEVGLNFPKSFTIKSVDDVVLNKSNLTFPMIVKPVKPLSQFKVSVVNSVNGIEILCQKYAADLPFLIQKYIPGDDRSIYFGAIYQNAGKTLARFEGHKLHSRPMGHTCIAEPFADDKVNELTEKFYSALGLSGPLSLELKKDSEGAYWVIEPTVGRTDFWVGLCIQNNVNFPFIEYQHDISVSPDDSRQKETFYWVNGERDPAGLLRILLLKPSLILNMKPAFLYCSISDVRPYIASVYKYGFSLASRLKRKLGTYLRQSPKGKERNREAFGEYIDVYSNISQLPEKCKKLFNEPGKKNFDLGFDWFEVLEKKALARNDKVRVYALTTRDDGCDAVLPFRNPKNNNKLYSLSNFYTSLFSTFLSSSISIEKLTSLYLHLKKEGYSHVDLHPLDKSAPEYEMNRQALQNAGWSVFDYFCFGNWYLMLSGKNYEQYYSELPSALKNTIKRKKKKYFTNGNARIEILRDDIDMPKAISDYESIYRASWKKAEPYPDFISTLIHNYAKKKQIRLGLVYVEDVPIAAQIWIVKEDKASIYKLAYDNNYSKYSAGTILSDCMMRYVVDEDKVNEVDYLIGDDAYKKDWMSHRRERWGIIAYNPDTFYGYVSLLNEKIRRKMKSVLSGNK